ncbi:MAG: glutamate--cysteine ligase [Burkholderiales bacterium]
MIPHLISALAKPLADLEARMLASSTEIEYWFRQQWQEHTPPFYGSVDLRNSGFKLAPVDMNLFPGGFNNLNAAFQPVCVQAVMSAIEKICPDAKNLLLIPENHTRNLFYLRNVARLKTIMRQAGLNVRIGTLNPEITAPVQIEVPDNPPLTVEPLVRKGGRVGLADFDPCTILLNNDLSSGLPEILKNVHEQFVLPPLHAGWAVRRKTKHFAAYDRVVADFAKVLAIDPWLLNPYFAQCGQVNFQERSGEECLATNVSAVLEKMRAKYLEYGITEEPFVVVKANAGTYGMGIMTATSADDVVGLNRKQRNKMAVVKEGMEVTEVIIQEGVHTAERVNGGVAEPVVYMIDRYVVGGFYRVNTERGVNENLNAPGMTFEQLAFEDCCTTPDHFAQPSASVNRFYNYGVVARLASVAAAIELEETAPQD